MTIKNQDGVTIVEFALIAPLLFLLIFGMIEFSLLLFNKHVITNASREIARAGVVAREDRFIVYEEGSCAEDYDIDAFNATTVGNTWLQNNLVTFGENKTAQMSVEIWGVDVSDPKNPSVVENFSSFDDAQFCTATTNPYNGFRCPLKVTVSYDYHFLVFPNLMELIRGDITDTITLQAESVMLME